MITILILVAVVATFAAGFAIGRAQGRAVAAPPPALTGTDDASRQQLVDDLAKSRADVTRYRNLIVDIENNAPSPLMGPGAPDDLKLIVGVGPVLERMLHQLGVTAFQQIAYWTESDIDAFDAKLHEFPGRIRRDGWVTQARALHQSKYGETLPLVNRK